MNILTRIKNVKDYRDCHYRPVKTLTLSGGRFMAALMGAYQDMLTPADIQICLSSVTAFKYYGIEIRRKKDE